MDGQRFVWSWHRGDEPAGSIGIAVYSHFMDLDYTWTPHGYEPRSHRCAVAFERTPCRFGGQRVWFTCPDCGRTCAVLFGPSRRGNFACRVCQRLAYSSEAESAIDRCWRQQRKLEARLSEHGGPPKGMHGKTFARIVERIDEIELQKDDLFLPGLFRLARRYGMTPDELFK